MRYTAVQVEVDATPICALDEQRRPTDERGFVVTLKSGIQLIVEEDIFLTLFRGRIDNEPSVDLTAAHQEPEKPAHRITTARIHREKKPTLPLCLDGSIRVPADPLYGYILEALSVNPLTVADVTDMLRATKALNGDRNFDSQRVSDACFALQKDGRIGKGEGGRWRVLGIGAGRQ